MVTVDIREAKTQLSKLVERVVQGETLVIARAGKPLVKVTALAAASAPRRLGFLAGEISVPDDFDRLGESEIAAPVSLLTRDESLARHSGPVRKV
ncbi:MAG: type II toxin-antitoxin system prevent-host-death family antitoxin [Thermoanaerobaculia bacterium]